MSTAPEKLFVIDLTYTADLREIDASIPGHMAYLDDGYAAGVFLASGRKNPRTGGIIIATETTLEAIQARAAADPFVQKMLASVRITEFEPSKTAPALFGG